MIDISVREQLISDGCLRPVRQAALATVTPYVGTLGHATLVLDDAARTSAELDMAGFYARNRRGAALPPESVNQLFAAIRAHQKRRRA